VNAVGEILQPRDEFHGIRFGVERSLFDGLRSVGHGAQVCLLAHDASVVPGVRRARQAVGELRDVGDAAGRFELRGAFERFHQRDEVNGDALSAHREHCARDHLVLMQEEVFGRGCGERVEVSIVEQDGTEDGALSFEIRRQPPVVLGATLPVRWLSRCNMRGWIRGTRPREWSGGWRDVDGFAAGEN
jgi:hypothetical protein